MSAEVHDVLVKARDLIADPERWTQGELARDQCGQPVDPFSPRACRWCLEGAVARAANMEIIDDLAFEAHQLLVALTESDGYFAPYDFNDFATHADVLALFDRAIEATKP